MTYCTNLAVVNACPPQMRQSNDLDAEITIWKPYAEECINSWFQEKYETPLVLLSPDPLNSHLGIKQACALLTVYYLLTNSFSEYNFELPKEKEDDKTQHISSIKYYQAKCQLKKWLKTDYIDPDLILKPQNESIANYSGCVKVVGVSTACNDNFLSRVCGDWGRNC